MLREKGLVTALDGNLAIVHTENKLACSSCKVSDSCGNGIVEKYLAGKIFISKIENKQNAKVGDEVYIEISKSSVTKASVIVYLVPLFAFLAGASITSLITTNENVIILYSLLSLFLGLLVTKFYNRYFLNAELYLPTMVSIVDTGVILSKRISPLKANNTINIEEIH